VDPYPAFVANLTRKARAGCQTVRRTPWEDIFWFHGKNNLKVVEDAYKAGGFTPANVPRVSGKKYGRGFYLAPTQCVARAYGEFVFTLTLNGVKLLVVTHDAPDRHKLNEHVLFLSIPENKSLAEQLRVKAIEAPIDVVADWAHDNGYDGLFLTGVSEGTIVTIFKKFVPIIGPPMLLDDRCENHGH
jgi:hypothetical protein